MVPKKSSKADLENKKSLFFEIGLAFAMLLVLMAFEWKTERNIDVKPLINQGNPTTIDLPPLTTRDPDKLVQPAPPKTLPSPDKITIVPNHMTPRGDVDIFNDPNPNGPIPEIMKAKLEDEVEEAVYIVEEMPKFGQGGLDEFRTEFVMKKLRYPEVAQSNNIWGCVYVEFVVEKDGSVSNVKSLREIDESLVQEALRVVKESPKWTPGKNNGRPVRVKYVLPINFVLRN
ncbi:MAG: energy transducer TonB [Bacteroidales bacterium]